MKLIGIHLTKKLLSLSLGLSCMASPFAAFARRGEPTNPLTSANSSPSFQASQVQAVRGIENAGGLRSFYEALAAIREGRRTEPIRIAHYGDSHTAANILTAQIRRNFERDFGSAAPTAQARSRILYDVLGINGARAVRLLSWNEQSFLSSVSRRNPDLIILAYGTNEVTDNNWNIQSYQRLFVSIMRRFRRAAPNASILIYGPPDRAVRGAGGWQSVAKMTALLEAQRRAAIEMGAAFWSSYAAMGGAGSMNLWVGKGLGQPDHVHLTARGYIRMGDMFYEDFLDAYQAYVPAYVPSADRQQSDLRRALQF